MNGQVAFVTGGVRGIGLAICQRLAARGVTVAAGYSRDSDAVKEFSQTFQGSSTHQGNIGESADCERVINEVLEQHGRLDILVNNAGIIRRAPALEVSSEDWEAVLDLNLTAGFYLSQAAAGHYVSTGHSGKIINIVSMLSFQGGALVPAYTAAKSGLAGLTRALANEWAAQGINVNAIAPGYMETELTSDLRADSERGQAMLARVPAGRWGRPTDLKGAAVFLASDASAYLHGTIIPVDGGWLAW